MKVKETFQITSQTLNVYIPRVKLDQNLDLSDKLARMGIHDLFIEGLADPV